MSENKPNNIEEVQLDETELEQVVGGAEVLALQGLALEREKDSCVSFCSCTSSVSSRSA